MPKCHDSTALRNMGYITCPNRQEIKKATERASHAATIAVVVGAGAVRAGAKVVTTVVVQARLNSSRNCQTLLKSSKRNPGH